MLIRLNNDILNEIPDEIGILILADPSYGNAIPDLTPQDVNVLIHGILGALFDSSVSLDENMEKIVELYSEIPEPSESNQKIAMDSKNCYGLHKAV